MKEISAAMGLEHGQSHGTPVAFTIRSLHQPAAIVMIFMDKLRRDLRDYRVSGGIRSGESAAREGRPGLSAVSLPVALSRTDMHDRGSVEGDVENRHRARPDAGRIACAYYGI